MPEFKKKSLSLFLRNNCERQFRLSVYTDHELSSNGMPHRQQARSGLGLVGQAGDVWQDQKVSEVSRIFGAHNVHSIPAKPGQIRPQSIPLETVIANLKAFEFVVEAAFFVPARFSAAFNLDGINDEFGSALKANGKVIPDIVQVLPHDFTPVGSTPWLEIKTNGDLLEFQPNDERLRLRIIDVKLTAEPGANYFAEVVYYSMVLAAWLEEHGHDQAFAVVAAGAVWPGSHDASVLAQKELERQQGQIVTTTDLANALEEDLEVAEFSVFVPRLRRLLFKELPNILASPWQDLGWHTNFRCLGCEFLGYPWQDSKGHPTEHALHCWQVAEKTDHLSRIPGLTRGATSVLKGQVQTVNALAALPSHASVFAGHPTLKARRAVIAARAQALQSGTATTIPQSGTSAVMPRWSDLKVWISLDFDPSSAITAVMSLRASWIEPQAYGSTQARQKRHWGDSKKPLVHVVDTRSLAREEAEFLGFLQKLKSILDWVSTEDATRKAASATPDQEKPSSYQIYLWDDAQLRHLIRLVGRHLAAIVNNPKLRDLAWLFPPPELLSYPESASRKSPVTLVADAVDSHVAVPVPHHYTLLEVVKHYHQQLAQFSPRVHPLYQEPLSNLIPAERIHEVWSRRPNWTQAFDLLRQTSLQKTFALALISNRLQEDLRATLSTESAPAIVRTSQALERVSLEGELWYQFNRLNAAHQQLDAQVNYAMAAHEREARLKAAYLPKRIDDPADYTAALQQLNTHSGTQLMGGPNLWIYELSPDSSEVNLREGAFGLALSPRQDPMFLNRRLRLSAQMASPHFPHADQYVGIGSDQRFRSVAEGSATRVTISAMDRQNGLIALTLDRRSLILEMQRHGDVDFSQDVMLDQTAEDTLSKKLKVTIQAIKQPPGYANNPLIAAALPNLPIASKRQSKPLIAWDYLYTPTRTHAQKTPRNTTHLQSLLAPQIGLNPSQWNAWQHALEHRLTLIWGPPGTGKSATLRAVVRGAVLDAQTQNTPLRILITANTYTAVDNVLLKLEEHYRTQPTAPKLYRVQSYTRPDDATLAAHTGLQTINLNPSNPAQAVIDLRNTLETPSEIVIVGITPQQLHNLAYAGAGASTLGPANREWFDLVILDEASQLDTATSTLIFSKVAAGGACVLAGDDLQLAPIQPAEPPEKLEDQVGSVYGFMRYVHGIVPVSLDINYRSNQTIVDFVKLAGYSNNLSSHSPNLRLHLRAGFPSAQPATWPANVPWLTAWTQLLDPNKPVTCFVYDDPVSGQSNEFEAQAVTALIALLEGQMAKDAHGQNDPTGHPKTATSTPYTASEFWEHGIGIVTPHRAQVGKIVEKLTQHFANTNVPHKLIRSAVDTVERFQGQERDVIIASFGLGDPDTIGMEDEFLYKLNRFNVMASRARCKLVVLMTRTLLDHLSNDQQVLRESGLLKRFAETYCQNPRAVTLGFTENGAFVARPGELLDR